MNENKNRYPHDFRYWHDVRIDEYHKAKAIADEEKRQELYAQFAIVADKYSPLERNKEPNIASIAKSPADLLAEGDALNHCVGRNTCTLVLLAMADRLKRRSQLKELLTKP